MSTTDQKHAQLKKISQQHRKNIYDMLRLANEILSDHDYVDRFGGEADMIDMMEADEFAHFGGQPSLSAMLRAFRANPKKGTWQEYNFNLRVMIDLSEPQKDRGETMRINWKARCAELQEKLKATEATLADYKQANVELREKCDALGSEAGELRGQLKMLSSRQMSHV